MEEKRNSQPLYENAKKIADKLPDELRANYHSSTHKSSGIVECLKVAAVLKLWFGRGYREIGFVVPSDCDGKTVYIDVVARDTKGIVGVECVSSFNFGRLRRRVEQLRISLPTGSYLILAFPFRTHERSIEKALELVDEVWVMGKDGKVERMMFTAVFHKG